MNQLIEQFQYKLFMHNNKNIPKRIPIKQERIIETRPTNPQNIQTDCSKPTTDFLCQVPVILNTLTNLNVLH